VTERSDLVVAAASLPVAPAVHRLSPADVVHEVAAIKQIMAEVMKEGEHYGKVPGSTKPGLFQPGAQILCLTFRLGPRFRVTKTDLPEVIASSTSRPTSTTSSPASSSAWASASPRPSRRSGATARAP